jgi:hypothetical protein
MKRQASTNVSVRTNAVTADPSDLRIAALDTNSPRYHAALIQCLGEVHAEQVRTHAHEIQAHYICIAMLPGKAPPYLKIVESWNTIEELTDAVQRHYVLFSKNRISGMHTTFCTLHPRLDPTDRDFLYRAMDRLSMEFLAMADARGSA